MAAEHAAQHAARDREIRCAEKYPGDTNPSVGGEAGHGTRERTAGPRFVFKENSNHALNDQIRTVQQSPDNERPGRAVPETTEKHDDDEIQRHPKRGDLVAAERNVKVIAQESGKRDVPAPPEIGEADRGVGKTKIVLEMKTESERG